MVWLPDGKKWLKIGLAVSTEPAVAGSLRDAERHWTFLCHSRSLKVIRNDSIEYGMLVFHYNTVSNSYHFWDI